MTVPITATPYRVAVIGTGLRGMMVLERIAARLAAEPRDRAVEVLAIDAVEVGAGRVYRTDHPDWFLMNIVLGQISAFSGLSDDEQARAGAGLSFWEWREAAEPDCQGPDGYSPRGTYGRYLRYVLDAIEAGLPDGVTLRRVRDRVLELVPTDGRYRLRFAGRPSVDVDRVVLTTGHSTPEPTGTAKEWADFAAVRTGLRYIASDSAVDMPLGEVKPGTAVGVLGLGLSFFDVVAVFTTGRGGQFDETGDGSLCYLLSGDEPSLVAGSLSSAPLLARGRNQKPPNYSYRPVLFRPEHVAPRAGGLDFRADVLPWMLAEIDLVRCGTELEVRFGPDVRAAFVDEVRGRACRGGAFRSVACSRRPRLAGPAVRRTRPHGLRPRECLRHHEHVVGGGGHEQHARRAPRLRGVPRLGPRGRPVQRDGCRDRPRSRVHERLRVLRRPGAGAGVLRGARGTAAGLRGGPGPRQRIRARLWHVRALPVARRTDPPPQRRAHRVRRAPVEPDRREAGADDIARAGA